MRRLLISVLFSALAVVPVTAPAKVKLPHKNMSDAEACPGFQSVNCAPDDGPRLLFNLVPPVLEIDDAGKPRYELFLGRAFRQPYKQGMIGQYCDNGTTIPFRPSDYDLKSASSSFSYKYKLKSEFSASADADLVKALEAAGLPPASLDKVKAAAKAAYNRQKNREIITTGRALLVRLNDRTVQELLRGSNSELQGCRNFLRANSTVSIVKAMMVFKIENSSSMTDIHDSIVADVKASLADLNGDQLAGVQSALNRQVDTELKSALSDRYIVWSVTWLNSQSI